MDGVWRRWLAVAAGLTVSLGIGTAQSAPNGNGNPNPGVLPPQSNALGASYGEWSVQWWQWAASLPSDMHPLTDTADCSAGQSGPAWFLGGSFAEAEPGGPNELFSSAERTCTIPSGTALFFPVLNVSCDEEVLDPELDVPLEEQLRDCANFNQDHTTGIEVTITHDGVTTELQGLSAYRVESPLYTSDPYLDPNFDPNLDPGPDNDPGNVLGQTGPIDAVSAGVYLMLAPLPVGTYTLHFEGAFVFSVAAEDDFDFLFALDITYELTVVPGGQYVAP